MASTVREPPPGSADVVFSVIVPTFNRVALLTRCLEALARQSFPCAGFEVLVCDDGSSDGTDDMVRSLAVPFRLTYLRQENAGPASARNVGIREAKGEHLLIINDDTVLDPDALEHHHRAQLSNAAEKIAVLGTFSLPPEAAATPLGYVLQNSDMLFDYPNMEHASVYGFTHFYTCNISISRKAVLDVGLFDEDYSGPAAEDLDLGYRLEKQGFRVLFRADCRGWHLHEISPAAFRRTHTLRGHGAMTFLSKHPEVPFYPGLDAVVVKRWRDEAGSRHAEADAIVAHLESEQSVVDDVDELVGKAKQIFPLVRTLMIASARRGIVEHPAVDGLMARRSHRGRSPVRPAQDPPKSLIRSRRIGG